MNIKKILLTWLLLLSQPVFGVAVVDEHIQWLDTNGKPIVNGYIYVGVKGANPVTNPITIYSDRSLSTPITNPQRTDAYGRSVNKIWIPNQYSIRIDNSSNVQKFIDLDRGNDPSTGTTKLSNIQGTNTITATGAGALVDGQIYVFQAVGNNTTAVTLNIDSQGAFSVVHYPSVSLASGAILDDQMVTVVFDDFNNQFQILSNTPQLGRDLDVNNFDITNNTGDITVEPVSTAAFAVKGNPTQAGRILLNEDTDNGTNYTGLKGAALIASNVTFELPSADGSGGNVLKTNGSAVLSLGSAATLGTESTATGGIDIEFTSIPSSVNVIHVSISGLSTNGTSVLIAQIGDSGGHETSGYSGATSTTNYSAGFIVEAGANAAAVRHGAFSLLRMNTAGTKWAFKTIVGRTDAAQEDTGGGTKTLSAQLDRLRLRATNGTDTFDANGGVNIIYY